MAFDRYVLFKSLNARKAPPVFCLRPSPSMQRV
jgi:hypothetical protein